MFNYHCCSTYPQYAHVRLPGGHETTISTKQVAPAGTHEKFIANENVIENIDQQTDNTTTADIDSTVNAETVIENQNIVLLRRSSRQHRAPDRLDL